MGSLVRAQEREPKAEANASAFLFKNFNKVQNFVKVTSSKNMVTTRKIENITFDQNFMYLRIDNKDFKISLAQISTKLLAADDMQRMIY
jgi:hypothetical protein